MKALTEFSYAVTPLVTAIGVIVVAVLQFLQRRQVAQVKQTLEENTTTGDRKLDALGVVARATHTLVNNAMGVQLGLTVDALRDLMTVDPSPLNRARFVAAEKALGEHLHRQAAVDQQPGSDLEKQGGGQAPAPVAVDPPLVAAYLAGAEPKPKPKPKARP